MKKYIFAALALLLYASASYAQKVILPDFHADPSAHYWDGKYWIYPSTDEPGSTTWRQMRQWHCYSSKDLVNWTNEGKLLDVDDISWAEDAAFAPDAMKWKGKYYFFFPAGMKIGVAISDKPNGPFKDALGKPLIGAGECPKVSTFDPCIFIDDDKTPYLYYGGGGGCAVVKLNKKNLLERDGELTKLPLEQYAEGIWVHKYKGLYYFTYPNHYKDSEGNVKQLLVYSTSTSPMGPFTFRGPFLDNKSRNSHHSIIEIKGQWYLFYHIQGPSYYERRVCVDYLEYNDDGTIKEVKMTKEGIRPIK